jgi:cation diffusion facilitator family transporter
LWVLGFGLGTYFIIRRQWTLLAGWALAMAAGKLWNEALKAWLARPRPSFPGWDNPASGYGFPSGHTMQAMIAYGMLVYLGWRRVRPREVLLAGATVLIALIALSRLVLVAHFPSDVIGGLLAGALWLLTSIAFTEAMVVAVLGLVVNIASAWLLRDREHASHDTDQNLRAAYLHVLADALTSVLAIAALAGGKFWGLTRLDPIMGVVGAVVVGKWAIALTRDTAAILLDMRAPEHVSATVRQRLESTGASIRDLALWYVGPQEMAASVCLAAPTAAPPETYTDIVRAVPEVAFVRVEVHNLPCPGEKDHDH